MATQKKFLVFSFILAVVLVMTTGIHAFAKSGNVTGNKAVERESVTGPVTEIFESDTMQFLQVMPATGEETWVAVYKDVSVTLYGEYTFEGPVFKNYKVKILKRKFKKLIYSSGPEE